MITEKAYARAGLVGNPSDGYFGKTISFIVRNYGAFVDLYPSPQLAILPSKRDHSVFPSLSHLARDVHLHGYYGGVRLVKAALKRFHQHCQENGIKLHGRNFTVRYGSDVPPQVGMAGSSAIICACFRALMKFYEVSISPPVQANLILSVERDELSIPAGLQDRVIQVYEGLVYMDFDRTLLKNQGYGNYEPIDPALLPPVYVAFSRELSEGTEVLHNDLRGKFERGDPEVVSAMQEWAGMAAKVRDLLLAGRGQEIGPILNANFDLRRKICQLSRGNIAMVEAARSVGASAKFTGSGGAIVGTYEDEAMFQKLSNKLTSMNLELIKPQILPPDETR